MARAKREGQGEALPEAVAHYIRVVDLATQRTLEGAYAGLGPQVSPEDYPPTSMPTLEKRLPGRVIPLFPGQVQPGVGAMATEAVADEPVMATEPDETAATAKVLQFRVNAPAPDETPAAPVAPEVGVINDFPPIQRAA